MIFNTTIRPEVHSRFAIFPVLLDHPKHRVVWLQSYYWVMLRPERHHWLHRNEPALVFKSDRPEICERELEKFRWGNSK